MDSIISVIGGGLAGSEAAWQLAIRGHSVKLYEMRPKKTTGAHHTGNLAELVCSNSLGSTLLNRPSGLLQKELQIIGSKLLECAQKTSLPAGSALAVDRIMFSELVEQSITSHKKIEVIHEEISCMPSEFSIIASGPLTSKKLASNLASFLGENNLYFYDALAPIVSADSIDMTIAYRGSRYNRGMDLNGDYINCPFTQEQYDRFIHELLNAETSKHSGKTFAEDPETEKANFFEGCLPIEVLAKRGKNALAFGPMRPTGLRYDNSGNHPFAVVQLRQDNLSGELYNMVGFQTNLAYNEQLRVFRLIPGLEKAEFIRYGQMHRNTYINAPRLVKPTLQLKSGHTIFIAGQLAGIEGYLGSIASGLVAGLNLSLLIEGERPLVFPKNTILGSLLQYISHAESHTFQPMKANFGLMPVLPVHTKKKFDRNNLLAERSLTELEKFCYENKILQ